MVVYLKLLYIGRSFRRSGEFVDVIRVCVFGVD